MHKLVKTFSIPQQAEILDRTRKTNELLFIILEILYVPDSYSLTPKIPLKNMVLTGLRFCDYLSY